MEITKEYIFKNIEEAINCYDYCLDEEATNIINIVIDKNYEELQEWSFNDYNSFGVDVAGEGLKWALKQYDLLNQNILGLPSDLTIENLIDNFEGNELEEIIAGWLSENYGYCVNDFSYEIHEDGKSVDVFDIEWDIF